MPQATHHNSRTASKTTGRKPAPVDTARELVSAHRRAQKSEREAEDAIKAAALPSRVQVCVPEIGRNFVAYSVEQLDAQVRAHIEREGLTRLEQIDFQKRMSGYRSALTALHDLYQAWRDRNGIDALEAAAADAYDHEQKLWKAMLTRARSHPGEIAELASYVGTEELMATNSFYRHREMLRAIAAGLGRRVRK